MVTCHPTPLPNSDYVYEKTRLLTKLKLVSSRNVLAQATCNIFCPYNHLNSSHKSMCFSPIQYSRRKTKCLDMDKNRIFRLLATP